jgi:hypothetical protein
MGAYEFGFKAALAAQMCMKTLRRLCAEFSTKDGADERPQNDRSPAPVHYFLNPIPYPNDQEV